MGKTHVCRSQWMPGLLVATLWGLMGPVDAARAEVTEKLSYSTYTVEHKAGQSMLQVLNLASPIREGGQVFHGFTKWNVRWTLQWHFDARGECQITGHVTALTGVITLPELFSPDAQARQTFSTYIAALRQHEMGHYQIAQLAARRIDEGLQALPMMPSCEELSRKANQLGTRLVEQARQDGFDYDRQTEHGRTQGAWLPR